ncbi:MAG: T9SS type A sorting domain-containing protein [Bacteroidia bacterium]
MKNLCFTSVVALYIVFLCFAKDTLAQPGTRPSFAVWDCDGQGMMAPPPGSITVASYMALLDSVGFAFPPGSNATDVKFIFQFEDSAGNALNISLPTVSSKNYELAYNLQSLPAGVTLINTTAGMDIGFRINTKVEQPSSGSYVKVRYEVWAKDATTTGYSLLLGQTKSSWYKHNLSCNKIMGGKARIGQFDQPAIVANPNPFRDYLYIEANAEEAVVKIMDSQGRTIRVLTVPSGDRPVRFPTGDLPAGLYFLQKQSSTGIRTLPMVKTQ